MPQTVESACHHQDEYRDRKDMPNVYYNLVGKRIYMLAVRLIDQIRTLYLIIRKKIRSFALN